MTIVKNPDLIWDGKTEIGEGGRPLEAPSDWELAVERMPGEPAPYIYHREKGFNVDANHIRANISWSQQVTIPAGAHYVIVHCFSHVTWGDDEFTVGWWVELQTHNQTYKSDDVWLQREKGDQSFAIEVTVPQETRATLRVIYWTKWADTNGALDLSKIDIQPHSWGVAVRDKLVMGSAANIAAAPPPVEEPVSTRAATLPTTLPITMRAQAAPQNPAFATAMLNLSAAMQECVTLTKQDTSNATVAQALRVMASALMRSADTLEKSNP